MLFPTRPLQNTATVARRDFASHSATNGNSLFDFVVVYGRSDALFPWLLAALLLALAGLNVIWLKMMNRERGRLLWSGIMLLVPLCILAFQVSCLAGVRRQIIDQHREVLDYRLPWISR